MSIQGSSLMPMCVRRAEESRKVSGTHEAVTGGICSVWRVISYVAVTAKQRAVPTVEVSVSGRLPAWWRTKSKITNWKYFVRFWALWN